MDSLKALELSNQHQPTTEPLSRTAMNRNLFTVIDSTGPLSRRVAMPLTQVQGWQLAGKPAPVAYAHDCGRESDDTHTSGEGPG